jgi:hypothetical protein
LELDSQPSGTPDQNRYRVKKEIGHPLIPLYQETDLSSHCLIKGSFFFWPDIDMDHLRHLEFQALSSNSIYIRLIAMAAGTVATPGNGYSFTAC